MGGGVCGKLEGRLLIMHLSKVEKGVDEHRFNRTEKSKLLSRLGVWGPEGKLWRKRMGLETVLLKGLVPAFFLFNLQVAPGLPFLVMRNCFLSLLHQ